MCTFQMYLSSLRYFIKKNFFLHMWVTMLGSDLVGISVLSQIAPVQRSFFFPEWVEGRGEKSAFENLTFYPLELAGSYLYEGLLGTRKEPRVEAG